MKSTIWRSVAFFSTLLIFLVGTTTPVHAADDDFDDDSYAETADPLYKLNRKTQGFNDFVDRVALKPVATGYKRVVPQFARNGVKNFFANLGDINNAVNNLLQGKFAAGAGDIGRLLINSTLGLGGLFDPATNMGLVEHEEDWGQTFATWGMPTGPYIVIPGLGPGNARDAVSRMLDGAFDPVRYLYPVRHRNRIYAMRLLQQRTDLLSAEGVIFGDRYIFFRDAYLQRREYLVKDGEVSDPFADDF